ncbi:lipase [Mycobacterium sp. M1]|uniref:Lipase n=1 Tax=Mycolicibacter acidiphilus TaxID=2835306 RepID=A0ABS5RP94_9MYCO|nr:lipase family protein [Mycolicibacter acidiphilus]MBS9536115.1 lipase [Mycolicibacter acidiphilus]
MTRHRAPLPPPAEDPFYRAPVGFEALSPGTVLRSRQVEIALFGRIRLRVSAWQLLYRSSDLHRRPETAVTTVLLPDCADPNVPRPILAYQCAIDAIDGRHSPSYALRRGAHAPACVPQYELLVIANALRRGWAVSIADHGGHGGYFGAPREPGYRVLDGVRAATAFLPLGLDSDAPIALWGYSGGGMASAWAAEMAGGYAPELRVVGAALGAPVGDPGQTLHKLNGTRLAGLPIMVIAAIRHLYPDLKRTLNSHGSSTGLDRLDEIETLGTIAAIKRFQREDLDDYTEVPLDELLARPEIADVIDDLRLGTHTPACPLLVVQPVHDQFIDVADVDGQVQRYIDAGAHVRYLRDRLSEHVTLLPLSTPMVLGWLADRFAGRPLPAAGVTTVWSVAASLRAILGLLMMGLVTVKAATGRRLTPRKWRSHRRTRRMVAPPTEIRLSS